MIAANKAWDICLLGLHSLTVHKARSALTAMGIIFGVWSVIVMLAINEGASYQAQMYLRELGSNNIIIESVKPAGNDDAEQQWVSAYGLNGADVRRMKHNIPGIAQVAISHRRPMYARVADRMLQVSVIGTEPSFGDVIHLDMKDGRFITPIDELTAARHCVVTASLANRLFRYENPVGQNVWLGWEVFKIVGVLRQLSREIAGGGSDAGNYVIIPYSTDMDRFGRTTRFRTSGQLIMEAVEISQCILQMEEDQGVIDGAAIARRLLEEFHEDQDFEVKVPLELIAQQKKQRRLWNIMLIAITSVSLLVGGIGIMNIMLASVTERTREIGVRRALGAKRRDIVVQFLVESVALTTAGGLIGIGAGVLLPQTIENVLGFKTIILPMTLMMPFVMAVAVGLVSGIYPALRAAKLDPIVALRHE